MRSIIYILTVALAGCAGVLEKPGGTDAEYRADLAACKDKYIRYAGDALNRRVDGCLKDDHGYVDVYR